MKGCSAASSLYFPTVHKFQVEQANAGILFFFWIKGSLQKYSDLGSKNIR